MAADCISVSAIGTDLGRMDDEPATVAEAAAGDVLPDAEGAAAAEGGEAAATGVAVAVPMTGSIAVMLMRCVRSRLPSALPLPWFSAISSSWMRPISSGVGGSAQGRVD
jgi:hypothetical protein